MSSKKVQVTKTNASGYINVGVSQAPEGFSPGSIRGTIQGAKSNLIDLESAVNDLEVRMDFPPSPTGTAQTEVDGPGSLSGVAADVRSIAQSLYYVNLRLRRVAEAI